VYLVNNLYIHVCATIEYVMPTKQELEDDLNSKLDLDMEWSQMKKDDLELLKELVEEGHLVEPMVKKVVSEKGKDHLEDKVESWDPGDILMKVI